MVNIHRIGVNLRFNENASIICVFLGKFKISSFPEIAQVTKVFLLILAAAHLVLYISR